MPDYLTHAFLAEDAYNDLHLEKLKNVDLNYFIIGSQGPDPLFHFNYIPWRSSGSSSEIASMIHKKNTKAFLSTLLKNAKNASKDIKGFALGFLCHYALDTSAHPYIYHKAGNYSKTSKQYRGNHLRLEKAIDNYYVKQRGGNPRFYKAKNLFQLPELSSEFVNIFNDVMEDVYDFKDVGLLFARSYKDFRKSIHVLSFDPFGCKKIIYKIIDFFTDSSTGYTSLSQRANVKNIDFMNINKTTWKHPVTGDESNESFQELYDNALIKAKALIQLSIDYFNNQSEEIFNEIKNVSYDTNRDCDADRTMVHINSIFN